MRCHHTAVVAPTTREHATLIDPHLALHTRTLQVNINVANDCYLCAMLLTDTKITDADIKEAGKPI